MMPTPETGPEIVRWYTNARRFPKLIGKTPEGRAIWGGPYTQTQFVVGVLLLFVMSKTTGLWGHFGLIGNISIALGISYGATWGLGRLPMGARNPFSVAAGAYTAMTAPPQGLLAGHKISVAKQTGRGRSRLTIAPAPELVELPAKTVCPPDGAGALPAAPIVESPVVPKPIVSLAPRASRPMSSVQQLLAAAAKE